MLKIRNLGYGLILTALLSACGGGGRDANVSRADSVANDSAKSIYSAANSCFSLESAQGFVAADEAAGSYGLSGDPSAAARFYFKPTRLGAYLLMSAYQRDAGQPGSKQLLGISDPAGEFLDESGNFVGEVGFVVSGVGDIADFFVDPIAPLGGSVRDLGENVGLVGDRISDNQVQPALAIVEAANDLAVWNLLDGTAGQFTLQNDVTGQYLAANDGQLGLTDPSRAGADILFTLQPTSGCDAYPEAPLNLRIVDERGPAIYLKDVPLFNAGPGRNEIDNDDIFGFIDAHAHITAYEFIGGRVNYGDPFHKFGVDHALDDCSVHHGPQGVLGLVETATSGHGQPNHATQGWPDFEFWPRHNSLQHHQSYYRWLERAHMAGLKVLVNHFTGSEILCQLNPQKENACDFEENWRLQAQRVFDMQDYIDAQNGGPGEGWFRVAYSPAEARAIIADGKMAVVMGIEISKIFNCGEYLDRAECTTEQIIERMDAAYRVGVRHIFPVHKFDNALGGVVPDEGFGIGSILYLGNLAETGHPIEFEACPESFDGDSNEDPNEANPLGIIDQLLFQLEYIDGQVQRSPLPAPPLAPQTATGLCNIRGLTELGHFFVRELISRRMIVEVDHSSRAAVDRILEMTEANGYPGVTSSHDWLGSEELLDRVVANGGTISRFASAREGWVDKLNRVGQRPSTIRVGGLASTGMASDVNGIASLPGNNGDATSPLYPFTSVDGRIEFDQQQTGDHVFDLFEGRGVAHYGLYPDQIADMVNNSSERSPEEVTTALRRLFSSTEAYLRMWEATEAWGR